MIDALLDRGHTPYRQIGHRAVSHVMDRCRIAYTQDEVRWLVSQIETLKPFPDVVPALEKLRAAGYKLAILSNGDRDMLKAAGPHIGFPFDHVISVQEAGYFKPHWKTYAKAARSSGGSLLHPVRRQPRLRLHRRQGLRHAHGLHRPPQAPVRRDAASARPDRGRLRRAGGGAGLVASRLAGQFRPPGSALPAWPQPAISVLRISVTSPPSAFPFLSMTSTSSISWTNSRS